MTTVTAQFFFDFIDPLSYLLSRELREIRSENASSISWVGYEMHPPPTPLITVGDPSLSARWEVAREAGEVRRITFDPPRVVPWTRKAHELSIYADGHGAGDIVRTRTFEAYLFGGRDIGRVDVLVEIAGRAGLDTTEAKAVLDVDRFENVLLENRSAASCGGVVQTPSVIANGRWLRGFHNRTALRTFLGTE